MRNILVLALGMVCACSSGGVKGRVDVSRASDTDIAIVHDASSGRDEAMRDTPAERPGDHGVDKTDSVDVDTADPGGPADALETTGDAAGDQGGDTAGPECLNPVLPDSCLKKALECTGLATCGPRVTGCFQYGSLKFPQAVYLAWDFFRYFNFSMPQLMIGPSTMRIDYSNGARMLADSPDHPRAVYFSPDRKVCAQLGFDLTDSAENWKDYDIPRKYYLRYGKGKLVVIRPRFDASPGAFWRIDGYEVSCPDGTKENYTFDQFKPLAYLLFGGENRSGKSFLPYWTSEGCELGEFTRDCLHQEDVGKREWCDGSVLHVCRRGVRFERDCAKLSRTCVQIGLGYGGKVFDYHAFCTSGGGCGGDFCNGTVMGECWSGFPEYKDCAAIGGTCVLLHGSPPYTQTHAMCAPAPAAPCKPKTYKDHCEGNEARDCLYYGYEHGFDCSALGMTCVESPGLSGDAMAWCHPSRKPRKCSADFKDSCKGDVRTTCYAGHVLVEDCAARYGETCRIGSTGKAVCADQAAVPCTNTANNCVGCDGDRAVWCGPGGVTVFDDCARQGLGPTGGKGRTCYAGSGADPSSYCPVCGQKGAADCNVKGFKSYCDGDDMVKCFGDHQVALDCSEVFPPLDFRGGWCNVDKWGNAYCESLDKTSCDPDKTSSECKGPPPIAGNCTESGVWVKHDCLKAGLAECRMNAAGKAVCVQSGTQECAQAAFKPSCKDKATLVTCVDGFTYAQPCVAGLECGPNQQGVGVCHQAGAKQCDEPAFVPLCDGNVAVTCDEGFERRIDCPTACSGCACKSDDIQAWCKAPAPG